MTVLKRLLAAVLSLCLVLSLWIDVYAGLQEIIIADEEDGDVWDYVPVDPSGDEPSDYQYGPFTYELITDQAIQILRCNPMAMGELVIPDTINGIPVVKIGTEAFADCDYLTGVVLPSGLTGIMERAFYSCDGLTHITIPACVRLIVHHAFAECSNLDTVEFMGRYPQFAMWNPDSNQGPTWYDPWAERPSGNEAFAGTNAVGFYPADDTSWIDRTGTGCGILTWKPSCGIHTPGDRRTIIEATASVQGLEGQRCTVCGALLTAEWVSASGQVVTGTCGDGLTWKLNRTTGVLTVIGTGAIVDPCWHPYAEEIKTVNLETGVTGICRYAFEDHTNLKHISIPDTVTNIELNAFLGCDSLVYTVQEEKYDCKVTARYLGNAENPCYALISLSADDFAPDLRPEGFPYYFDITIDKQCKLIASAVDRISAFASYLVYDERIMLNVTLPEGLTTIGDDAFQTVSYQNNYDCSLLTTINLPNTLTSIGARAFAGCRRLRNITVPAGVRHIGVAAFDNCDRFTHMTLPSTLTKVPDWLFNGCNKLQSVTLPDTITAIGSYAFADCYSLTSVRIPAGVCQIGIVAFEYCTGLKNISFSGNAPVIGTDAFGFVTAGVCYPTGDVTWTAEVCQNYGGTLTWRTHDGDYISNGDATCTGDGTKTGPCKYCGVVQTVTDVGSGGHNPGQWITVKEATSTEDGLNEQYCTTCNELLASEVLQKYICGICGENMTWQLDPNTGILTISGSGVMDNTNAVPWEAYSDIITAVQISEGVENLRDYAFCGCGALTRIELPETMTQIGAYAFFDCISLTEITLPEALTELGSRAFTHCAGLTGIKIPQGVTQIRARTFEGCSALVYATLPEGLTVLQEAAFFGCYSMTEFILPDSLTTIDTRSLYKCSSLTGLTVPAKVTLVGSQAFYQCTGLTELTFTGNAPAFANDAFQHLTATVRYPAGNETWSDVVRNSYNGTVKWEPWGEVAVVRPTLMLQSPALEFRDMIKVVAFFTAENTDDVVEMGMITYRQQVDTVDVATADYVIPGASHDEISGRYYACSQGIHGKFLADTMYLACYAKLTDGSYVYTKLAPYSPITYAANQLKNSTDPSLKQLVAAMLNYGAEAQTYFGHHVQNLASADMTPEQLALPESFRSDMVASVPAASAEKQGIFTNNQGFSVRKPAISFEGAFCINYFFTPAYTPVDGITLYYWNEADFDAVDVLTTQNASGCVLMDGTGTQQYRGDLTGISAKDLSKAVYVAAVYSDGTTTWTSGVLGYSIGAYCVSQASKGGDIADLAMATAVYGYHAKQYFG